MSDTEITESERNALTNAAIDLQIAYITLKNVYVNLKKGPHTDVTSRVMAVIEDLAEEMPELGKILGLET